MEKKNWQYSKTYSISAFSLTTEYSVEQQQQQQACKTWNKMAP